MHLLAVEVDRFLNGFKARKEVRPLFKHRFDVNLVVGSTHVGNDLAIDEPLIVRGEFACYFVPSRLLCWHIGGSRPWC